MTALDRPIILAIAGSDSSGGAGIAADLLAAEALGADLRWAVTAVTAQSDRAVGAVHSLPPSLVCLQIVMALADGVVAGIKIGMLGTADCAKSVAETLGDHRGNRPVILDPVLMSSSGTPLLDEAGINVLIERLLPMATLLTPNLLELRHLADCLGALPQASIAQQAGLLMRAGARAVLVKGGHAAGPVAEDVLFERHRSAPRLFASRRIDAAMRGTGCRLSTAITARLAAGDDLGTACAVAKAHLGELLDAKAAESRTSAA